MEPTKKVEAQALFDYDRQHFDELSFKTGEVIKVLKQIEGGWWHGELNGTQGWSTDTSHLLSFQQEIVQHILEGESKQISDLNALSKLLQPIAETLSNPFLTRISTFLDKVAQIIRLHENIVKVLEKMKPLSVPKFVGKLFLDVAESMDQLSGEYTRLCSYIEFGLQDNVTAIPVAVGPTGQELYSAKTKALFACVFDRLSRYSILLKETERYYEDPHPDRAAICKAVQVYSEILERSNLLRSLREVDIEVLSSDIRGIPDQTRLQIGDPTLTLKANICVLDAENHFVVDNTKPQTTILLYSNFLIILSLSAPRVYQFGMHVPISNVAVIASPQNENVLSLKIIGAGAQSEEHNLHLWCTGVCTRDLFFSTVSEFIRNSTTNDGNAALRQRSVVRTPVNYNVPPEPTMRRRSGSCRSAAGGGGGSHDDSCAPNCGANHSFALRPSHSGPLCGPEAGEELATMPGGDVELQEPPKTNTMAVTDLTNLPGCRFLPHEAKFGALVKWPEDILTLSKRQESLLTDSAFQRIHLSPNLTQQQGEEVLTHLRLDRAPLQTYASLLSGGGDANSRSSIRTPASTNRGPRPASPGRSGGMVGESGGKGVAAKVMRRKQTDRQKSAINVDDILRSTGRFQEITQRNERDAKILQIIELYCGSGLPQGAMKPLDLTQLRLSCTEMRVKENSLPPPSNIGAPANTVPSRTYENLEHPLMPIRPPPVILPTSGAMRK
nr:rho guanine nucleotide exchange factor 7 [Hymenolepis microstoma]